MKRVFIGNDFVCLLLIAIMIDSAPAVTAADELAYYVDGKAADAAALKNLAETAGVKVGDLAGNGLEHAPHTTRDSFGAASGTPAGKSSGSSEKSEWLFFRAASIGNKPTPAGSGLGFTLESETGRVINLSTLSFDLSLGSASADCEAEAAFTVFVSVDGAPFSSCAAKTRRWPKTPGFDAVSTETVDLGTISEAGRVDIRIALGDTASEKHHNSLAVWIQGIRLTGTIEKGTAKKAIQLADISLEELPDFIANSMRLDEKVEQLNIFPPKEKRVAGIWKGGRSQVWNERLGIGPILALPGPRGPRPVGGILGPCSPVSLCLASTWDDDLVMKMGRQWGLLTKEYGSNAIWGPGVNIIKDPRAGRNSEYAGEDPFLSGRIGSAIVKGMQSVGVVGDAKHFVANNWETGRQSHNVEVPQRLLRELYLPAFRICVDEADAWSLMTCYNQVNGTWGSAHKQLMTDIVRKEWGFKGFYVSDWGAKFGSTAQAIKAGLNLELPGQNQYRLAYIQKALDAGDITMDEINTRVFEVLRVKKTRMTYYGENVPSGYNRNDFVKLMRRAGADGVVLLKNENETLPLSRKDKIALIGPFANDKDNMVGNQGSSTVPYDYAVTLKEALGERGIFATFTKGCDVAVYDGAEFRSDFPCAIEYFNGKKLEGPVVHKNQLASLNLTEFLAEDAKTMDTEGISGKAYHTDGRVAARVASTPSSDQWTLAAWVKIDDQFPSETGCFFELTGKKSNERIVVIESRLQAQNGGASKNSKTTWRNMDKRWISVALVSTGDSVQMYREGKLITECKDVGAFGSMDIWVGADKENRNGLSFDIDDLMIWNKVLSAENMAKLDNRSLAGIGKPVYKQGFEEAVIGGGGIPGIKDALDMSCSATGTFQLAKPGKVAFRIESNGGVRIRINGKLVYDLWDEQLAGGRNGIFWHVFNDTESHEMRVEFASKHARSPGYLRMDYVLPPEKDIFGDAVRVARAADVAVVCVGVDQRTQQAENRDRGTYVLPSWQDELVQAVHRVNPKTVVVLFTEGGSDLRHWIDDVPAVLEAYHPGSEGGNIISDVLFGDVNPSGKLTISWPMDETDLAYTGPDPHYHDTINEFGYRYFDKKGIKVRYPFGYGLSYTTFGYTDLELRKSKDKGYPASATITVTNTGKLAGKDVVQVYVSDVKSTVEQPKKELAGYAKVDLKVGESKTVDILLHWTAFKFFDVEQGKWILEPGTFTIRVGGSSNELPLQQTIEF